MADEKSGPTPIPNPAIALFYALGAIITLGLFLGGFWYLWIEPPDRGLGFGLVSLGTVIFLIGGWKFRWLQKRGYMGAPPAP